MKRSVPLRTSRLLQLAGLLLAAAGLAGFWWPQEPERMTRTVQQEGLLNPAGERFQVSFVVAGRDMDPTSLASACRWENGECIRERTGTFVPGDRTDTILYVNLVGDSLTAVAIPRDLWLPADVTRINAMYHYRGAEGVRQAVEDVLGVPVDHYAVIDIGIFESIVDALGGIDVNVPYRMYYRDSAAGLLIDLEEGPQRLSGAETAGFVRFRGTPRADIDRIDNVKRVIHAVVARVRQLNIRSAAALPQLAEAFFDQVETDVSAALLARLLPRLGELRVAAIATLPVSEPFRLEGVGSVLGHDAQEVERFLADLHGGSPREFSEVPERRLLISNHTGIPGRADDFARRLELLGVPAGSMVTREGDPDSGATRLLATARSWTDADWFTALFGTGKQQVQELRAPDGSSVDLEFVLTTEMTADAARLPQERRDATEAGTGSVPENGTGN